MCSAWIPHSRSQPQDSSYFVREVSVTTSFAPSLTPTLHLPHGPSSSVFPVVSWFKTQGAFRQLLHGCQISASGDPATQVTTQTLGQSSAGAPLSVTWGGGGGFHSNRPTEAKSLGPHLLHPEVTVSNVKGPQEWSRKAHGRGTGLSWPEPAEVAGLVAKKYLRRHRISLGF